MASVKKIAISSPRGLIIPKSVLGAEEDLKVGPHEPVSVPEAYGQSLIDDRFAEKYSASSKKAQSGKPDSVSGKKAQSDKSDGGDAKGGDEKPPEALPLVKAAAQASPEGASSDAGAGPSE